MSKISLKGILIGACAEIIISTVVAAAIFAYIISSHQLNLSPQTATQIKSIVIASPLLLSLNTISGFLITIIAGYVAAKFSRHNPLLNSVFLSFLSIPFGIYAIYQGNATLSFPYNFLALAVTPLLYMAGGYIWLKQVGKYAKP
jgi:hypothetical protein